MLFIAMRFVHGPNVQELDTEGPLTAARACHIITQVAPTLKRSFARAGKLGRRRATCCSIWRAGDYPGHAYLSDFGLSKRALSVSALTSTGQFLGTLDYIAPEQIEARAVNGRTDEYALACSAFTMLTGHPPFVRDESVAVMWAQISAPPPELTSRRPDLPAAVDEVMAKALAKVPTERYGTCPEFAAALRRACGLESGPGLVPGPAADFPDVPLRESTQVVPRYQPITSRTGTGSCVAIRSRFQAGLPASPDPCPAGIRRRTGPGPPGCPGLPAPSPKPSRHLLRSACLVWIHRRPRRLRLPPRRPRCCPTPRGMCPRSLRVVMPPARLARHRPSAAGQRRPGPSHRAAAGSGRPWRWPSSWSWLRWGTS